MTNPNEISGDRCGKCGIKMSLVKGFLTRSDISRVKGCYRCSACSMLTCYECSDSRKPCNCGVQQWEEQMYFV
jgi:hypothetical protein